MDEAAIAAQQRDNIPASIEPTKAPETPAPYVDPSAATAGVVLDDMMQYKLHEYFGAQYRSSDEQSKQRVDFIYKTVAERIGTNDYGYVVAQISNLEQMIGIAHADNRMYRLYEWLRLDGVQRKISRQQEALRG